MNKKLKICLAASAGGHLVQLLKISETWQDRDCFSVTTSPSVKGKLENFGPVFIVGESNRNHPLKIIPVMFKCLGIIFKQRPDVVISSGALHGCLLCLFNKLRGGKVVWLDSIANTQKLSLSGRIVRPFADMIFSQWPDVAKKYDNVKFAGSVV